MKNAIAFLVLLLLAGGAVADDAVFRLQLPSPLLMGAPSEGTPGDGSEGPPGGGTNDPGALWVTPPAGFPLHGTVGETFDGQIPVSGGVPGYQTFSDGTPPPGIDFTGERAYGTFTLAGPYAFRIGARDALNPEPVFTDEIVMSVELPVSASYAGWGMVHTIGEPLIIPAPDVSGGLPPYGFEVIPQPAGLQIDETSGIITYDPDAPNHSTVTLRVTDSIQREKLIEGLVVNAAHPVTLEYAQSSYVFDSGVSAVVPAPSITGGRGAKVVQVVSGALPEDVVLASNGAMSGIPSTEIPSGNVTLRAVDVDGRPSAPQTIAWEVTSSEPLSVWAMVVGGGGAGGARTGAAGTERIGGGGGGAGEVWVSSTNADESAYNIALVSGQSYPIIVGNGGSSTNTNASLGNGGSSSAFGKTSAGGGRGNGIIEGTGHGASSGGGAPGAATTTGQGTNNSGVPGVSYRKNSGVTNGSQGGGAGISTNGGSPAGAVKGGNGGAGLTIKLGMSGVATPATATLGGGGGGAGASSGSTAIGSGGLGGGGRSGYWNEPGVAGTVNTGSGGGGAGGGINSSAGGNGGKGVVTIVYAGTTVRATGGTVQVHADRVVHRFTNSGQFVVSE